MWVLTYEVVTDGRDPAYLDPDYDEIYYKASMHDLWVYDKRGYRKESHTESRRRITSGEVSQVPNTLVWASEEFPIIRVFDNLPECRSILISCIQQEMAVTAAILTNIVDSINLSGVDKVVKNIFDNRGTSGTEQISSNDILGAMEDLRSFVSNNSIPVAKFVDASRVTKMNSEIAIDFVEACIRTNNSRDEAFSAIDGLSMDYFIKDNWNPLVDPVIKKQSTLLIPLLVWVSYSKKD